MSMSRMLRKGWFMTIVAAVYAIGVLVYLIARNQMDYFGVFDLQMIIYLCLFSIWLVALSYRKIEERTRAKLTVRYIALLLPALSVVLFLLYKPAFNVHEALAEVKATSVYHDIQKSHLMAFEPRANWFVNAGYVFQAKEAEETVTLIFNPVTGQYDLLNG